MIHGGYWDKVGNEFEDCWALHQLVLLTSPSSDIDSLEREPVGDDERGVDLWVNRKNGIRECYQCKSNSQAKVSWSMTALRNEGILEHLQFQISRDPLKHRYHFVSDIPATLLKRLCDEARDSRDATAFWRDQILTVKSLNKAISEFCESLGLSSNSADREKVWSLLRRSSFILFLIDEEHPRELADRLEPRIDRDPMAALLALSSWLRSQRRCKIEIKGVADFLASIGFRLIRGHTDAFRLTFAKLANKRCEDGGLLRLEAEISALQAEIGRQTISQVQVLAARWRLLRKIDEGGFAEVWQEEDLEGGRLGSRSELVTVKILLAKKASDPHMVQRFCRGGEQMARITDSRIQKVMIGPVEEDGRYFYVMEHVEGMSLHDWLANKVLPLQSSRERIVQRGDPAYGSAAYAIISSAAEALSFMHGMGLVHGDVKPQNILINNYGMMKLCDFDLVQIQSAPELGAIALGTLPYLAPEVMACQKPTALSDQYSLAMTVVSVIHGDDLALSKSPMHLPELLVRLPCSIAVRKNLARALAPEPRKRFETVESFMNNLGPEAFEKSAL